MPPGGKKPAAPGARVVRYISFHCLYIRLVIGKMGHVWSRVSKKAEDINVRVLENGEGDVN